MRRAGWLVAAAVVGLAGAAPATETVCRPTALGGLRCSGPVARPEPRPVYRSDVQALDRVRPPAERGGTVFVPARETNRLGTTITDGPLPGSCRADRLGNTSCR